MQRYKITPEGLGEINIEHDDNGEWVRYDDIKQRPEVVPHDTVVSLHNALNELLNLFIHAVGRDYNTVDDALRALAKSDISLPISMYFKDEIDELRDLSN